MTCAYPVELDNGNNTLHVTRVQAFRRKNTEVRADSVASVIRRENRQKQRPIKKEKKKTGF